MGGSHPSRSSDAAAWRADEGAPAEHAHAEGVSGDTQQLKRAKLAAVASGPSAGGLAHAFKDAHETVVRLGGADGAAEASRLISQAGFAAGLARRLATHDETEADGGCASERAYEAVELLDALALSSWDAHQWVANQEALMNALARRVDDCGSAPETAEAPASHSRAFFDLHFRGLRKAGLVNALLGCLIRVLGHKEADLDEPTSASTSAVSTAGGESSSSEEDEDTDSEVDAACRIILRTLHELLLTPPSAPSLGSLPARLAQQARGGLQTLMSTANLRCRGVPKKLVTGILARCAMESPSPTSSPNLAMERLVAPVGVEAFLKSYWETCPVHLKSSSPLEAHRFASLGRSILAPVECEPPTQPHVCPTGLVDRAVSCPSIHADEYNPLAWLMSAVQQDDFGGQPRHGSDIRLVRCLTDQCETAREECWLERDDAVTWTKVLNAFERGYSTTCRAVHVRDALAATVSAEVSKTLGLFVGANLYVTPGNSQGLKEHYDDHCVILLQLSGRKKWALRPAEVAGQVLPRLYSPRATPAPSDANTVLEFVLCVGDVLYIPRGWPHQACTLHDCQGIEDVGSAHLTLAIEAEPLFTWEGALHVALRTWALENAPQTGELAEHWWGVEAILHIALDAASSNDERYRKCSLITAGMDRDPRASVGPFAGCWHGKAALTEGGNLSDPSTQASQKGGREALRERNLHASFRLLLDQLRQPSRGDVSTTDSSNNTSAAVPVHDPLHFSSALSTSQRILGGGAASEASRAATTSGEDTTGVLHQLRWLNFIHNDPSADPARLSADEDLEHSLAKVLMCCSSSSDDGLRTKAGLEAQYDTMKREFLEGACWQCVEAQVLRLGRACLHSRDCISAALRALHGAVA